MGKRLTQERILHSVSFSHALPYLCSCGSSKLCDDGDACTVDRCDFDTDTCDNEMVVCPSDQNCDPLDGECRDIEQLTPCIAVIDESDNYYDKDVDAMWAAFRAAYPRRLFCLIQPRPYEGYDELYIPKGFDSDPYAMYALVHRDHGDKTKASDWFTECGLDHLTSSGIDFVALFMDTSGSMALKSIKASNDMFRDKLEAAGMNYCMVHNDNENWIAPFNTLLGHTTQGGKCLAVKEPT